MPGLRVALPGANAERSAVNGAMRRRALPGHRARARSLRQADARWYVTTRHRRVSRDPLRAVRARLWAHPASQPLSQNRASRFIPSHLTMNGRVVDQSVRRHHKCANELQTQRASSQRAHDLLSTSANGATMPPARRKRPTRRASSPSARVVKRARAPVRMPAGADAVFCAAFDETYGGAERHAGLDRDGTDPQTFAPAP
jgi:hypothetical protein